jgi:putative membrane protein
VIRLLLLLVPAIAWSHTGEPLEPHDLWTAWRFDPGVVTPMAIAAILYARGSRFERGAQSYHRLSFWTGWTVLALALISPLHALGEALFSAHMAQHEILMLVAAPLLVLSRPLVPMLWGMPFEWRRAAGRWSKTRTFSAVWRLLTFPLAAWVIHAIALWAWHVPSLFQATLTSELAHSLQHLSFLLSALLFWWSLWYGQGRSGYGAAIVYIFTTAIHTSILGALLTLSPAVWYPAYSASTEAWGLTPLQDQQIGGLIMWIPAGVVYLAAGLAFCAAWLRESDAMLTRRAGLLSLTAVVAMATARCASNAAGKVTYGDPGRGVAAIGKFGCGSCHVIRGIPGARGMVGPPLDSFPTRIYIAGVLPNNAENFARWVQDPKSVDEKTAMPKLGVTQSEANDIAAYIYTNQ